MGSSPGSQRTMQETVFSFLWFTTRRGLVGARVWAVWKEEAAEGKFWTGWVRRGVVKLTFYALRLNALLKYA